MSKKFQSSLRSLALLCSTAVAVCMTIGSAQQPAAPAKAEDEKQQASLKPSSIKGRVIGDDGQPMANVPVVAVSIGRSAARRPGAGGQAAQTNTDDDGVFEFEGLTPASYIISASAPGYISPPPSVEGENNIGVYRAGDFANITLVKGGVITGKVTNAVGETLTGVSVNAIRVGGIDGEADNQLVLQGFGRNWRTDDRGVYRIYGLVPGAYIIQAGGGTGSGPNSLSPFSEDAPTYYPSSAREAAVPVLVRASEEIAGIDVSYRGGKGRVVSGKVIAKISDDGNRFSPAQVTLSMAGADAVVATALQVNSGLIGRGQASRGANGGFALYGVPDGEYEIFARRNGFGAESDAVSAPRHVSVRDADVGGIELILTPLASLNGRVVVEKKVPVCQQSRASSLEEILLIAERDEAQAREATLAGRLMSTRPAAPDATGEFTLRNLQAGRHRVIAQLPHENWYVRAISIEGKPPAPGARRTPASTQATLNVARNGVTIKHGERLVGMTVTIAEGAAGLKGLVAGDQGDKPSGRVRVLLIPAEKEAADDLLRYWQLNADGDGGFHFKNLAPGRYYLLAKPINDGGDAAALPQTWNNAQRAALRKEAEAAGKIIELQSCQRVNDYKLSGQ